MHNVKKNILVLGGDGFCGWPTSLHLSNLGYKVIIIDNLSRRKIDRQLKTNSLTPISNINLRIKTWNELSDAPNIEYYNIDVSKEYLKLKELILKFMPKTIIHFAEQRSAPYSMKNESTKIYTVSNNISATHNLLCVLIELKLDTHLIHLGTMGVYGYSGEHVIPEGYLDVMIKSGPKLVKKNIMYPADPGSIYHMTKTLDALMFYFYNKNDKLKITDLHQGIVWGTNTPETEAHKNLTNRFDYDGDFGTALNRFIVQGIINFPLTIYGTGEQKRAFININNTVQCIQLAIENPPKNEDKVKIYNQVTEVFSIKEIAKIIAKKTNSKIQYIKNPRNEAKKNDLDVVNYKFSKLKLNKVLLSEKCINEIENIAKKYSHRINKNSILPSSLWNKK